MLESFIVFTKAGVVLWSTELLPPLNGTQPEVSGAPGVGAANTLIREVLLRNANVSSLTTREHVIKFVVSNTADIVFVAVAGKAFGGSALAYVDGLLGSVRDVFLERYGARLRSLSPSGGLSDGFDFRSAFDKLLDAAESGSAASSRGARGVTGNTLVSPSSQLRAVADGGQANPDMQLLASNTQEPAVDVGKSGAAGDGSTAPPVDDEPPDEFAGVAAARARLAARAGAGGSGGKAPRKSGSAAGEAASPAGSAGKGAKGKSARTWNDDFKYTEARAAALNANKREAGDADGASSPSSASAVPAVTYSGTGAAGSGGNLNDADDDAAIEDGDEDVAEILSRRRAEAAAPSSSGGLGGWLARTSIGSMITTLAGNKVLERSDIEPVIDTLRATLVEKNVAAEVSVELCEAVLQGLLGTKVAAASSVSATVARALRDAINRILTPRRHVDVLAEVRSKKAAGGGVSQLSKLLPYDAREFVCMCDTPVAALMLAATSAGIVVQLVAAVLPHNTTTHPLHTRSRMLPSLLESTASGSPRLSPKLLFTSETTGTPCSLQRVIRFGLVRSSSLSAIVSASTCLSFPRATQRTP